MRLVTFIAPDGCSRAGVLLGDTVVDLATAAPLVIEDAEERRWDMLSLLCGDQEEVNLQTVADIVAAATLLVGETEIYGSLQIGGAAMLLPLDQVRLRAPLPRPASIRDFFSFEQHVAAAAALQQKQIPSVWYRIPTFYFGNHGAVYGPDDEIIKPQTETLDYELEIACVIGREGRDIQPEDAADYIAGYMVMNDWSARDIQGQEMKIGLGPAKGKDFATSLGPWLVTPDELELYTDDDGGLNLTMLARVNGIERSRGNAASMHYHFADLIAHASRDVTLYPGDVLGSGTVGTGCLLELTNGYGPWLERGDSIELEITGLGILRNTIV